MSNRQPIRKLGFKHQFCVFHTKQKINRDINDYLKQNKLTLEDIESVKSFKHEIFNIMDAPDLETAKTKRDQLIKEQKNLPEPIFKILWKFIVHLLQKPNILH